MLYFARFFSVPWENPYIVEFATSPSQCAEMSVTIVQEEQGQGPVLGRGGLELGSYTEGDSRLGPT